MLGALARWSRTSCTTALTRRKLSTQTRNRWLNRSRKDTFAKEARARGLRSRAAFKLEAIDDKHSVLKRGGVVLDLGCAPGSWSQIAMERGASLVIGVDIVDMKPMGESFSFIHGDMTSDLIQSSVREILEDREATATTVLADLSPKICGDKGIDHLRSAHLALSAHEVALSLLGSGGDFVCKIFQGVEERELRQLFRATFDELKIMKPKASRKDSREVYYVAKGRRENLT